MGAKHLRQEAMRSRIALAVLVLAAAILFSGCIDIVQYISGNAGKLDVYFRLTFQKSVFEMANSMSGEPQDMDELFAEFDLTEDEVLADLPAGVNAEFHPVNNEMEIGFEMSYSAARNVLDSLGDDEGQFVPRISPWGMSIPLSEGNAAESDEFADAFLGGVKYRLMISKRLVSRVSQARVLAGTESTPISITELPDIWLLEFPINLWYSSAETPVIDILF